MSTLAESTATTPPDPAGERAGDRAGDVEQRVRRRFESGSEIQVSPRGARRARPGVAASPSRVGPSATAFVSDASQVIEALLAEEDPLLSEVDRRDRARALAVEMVGLGSIQKLLDSPEVTDVLVNGPGRVWVERLGRLELTEVSVDSVEIMRCIERLVGPLGLSVDRANPVVDARLADGSRVTVVLPPLAPDGPLLAIRRHRVESFNLEAFGPERVVTLLQTVVERGMNVIVFGPTGSGKTSLLNALAHELPCGERVVTVEDTAELRLPGDHVVRLEARPGLADGAGRADIRKLVRTSLRLRPDRIVVGEVRGAEAVDMVWAMSTGHRGCLSTCHASGAMDALRRIETMVLLGAEQLSAEAVRAQVHSAVDVLVGVARNDDGTRTVRTVHGLDDEGRLTCLYSGSPGSGVAQ